MEEGKQAGSGLLDYLKPPYSLGVAACALIALAFVFPSMAWFIVVMFGLGYTLTRKTNFMTFGFGLVIFVVLAMLFNLLTIPLNWVVFLVVAVAPLAFLYYKKEFDLDFSGFSVAENKHILIVLLFFVINVYIFWQGATAYPYFEDGDPWIHATGMKWVTVTESFSTHYDADNFRRLYIEPYPPGYDVLVGVIHQLTDSLSDTMKFYNAFLVGMALIFSFYFFKALTKNKDLALLGAFFLLILPSFMSHFIWAQTLSMGFLFVAFYALEKGIKEKKYMIGAAIAIAAIAMTQPSTAAIFVLLAALYFVSKLYAEGKSVIKPIVTMGIAGLLLAMIYWAPIYLKYGSDLTARGIGITPTKFTDATEDTSGGIVYSISDFVFAPSASKIDQATGLGPVIFLLALAGLGFAIMSLRKEKSSWLLFSVLALVFCFLGTEGNALPVKLFPHRFWVFLSIPVAMLGAFAYTELEKRIDKTKKVFLLFILALAVFTSAEPKMTVQMAQWPPGPEFATMEELSGYIALKESLPANTKVFALCSLDDKIIGSDMLSEPWDKDYDLFKQDAKSMSAQSVYQFLKDRGYEYIVLDSTCVKEFGADRTNIISQEYLSTGLYQETFSTSGFLLMKLA